MLLCMCKEILHKIKKDTFDWGIKCYPLIEMHLKSTVVEIRCFCYFRSKINTTKNRSNIIKNRETSLFVIINNFTISKLYVQSNKLKKFDF